MKRVLMIVTTVALVSGLYGCLPEKRVVWSPDGRWAAVKGADGLYLCDSSGKLSQLLVPGVDSVAWLPDSKHLVFSHPQPVAGWKQLAPVLSDERRQEIADRAPRLREEVLAYQGDWKEFKPRSLAGLTGGEGMALLVYLRDNLAEGLQEKLGDRWKELAELPAAVRLLQLAHIDEGDGLAMDNVLIRALDAFDELRVSPTGQAVVYRAGAPDDDQTRPLYVVGLAGGSPLHVADHTAMFPDWSADGRHLVYAATKSTTADGKELRLGVVARRQICGDDGTFLTRLPESEELAGIAFQDEVRVRCLRDGRVLFATIELQLPCTSADMPQRAGLFAVDPGRQPGVTRLIPRSAETELPDGLFLFEVSPDERHVSIPGADGRVAVLTLATGDVWELVTAKDVDHLRTVPTWRSADELCFAIVPGDESNKQRAQIALAKLDWAARAAQQRIISADWPERVATDFLVEKPTASGQE